jgi:hypothetical protein
MTILRAEVEFITAFYGRTLILFLMMDDVITAQAIVNGFFFFHC